MIALRLFLFIFLACLTACNSTKQASFLNAKPQQLQRVEIAEDLNLAEKKATEEAAWNKVQKLSVTRCGVSSGTPPDRDRAVEVSNCISALVNQYILPQSAFPEIVKISRNEALRLARDYAAGSISSKEYQQKSIERHQGYKKAWKTRAEQMVLKAAEKQWKGDRQSRQGSTSSI